MREPSTTSHHVNMRLQRRRVLGWGAITCCWWQLSYTIPRDCQNAQVLIFSVAAAIQVLPRAHPQSQGKAWQLECTTSYPVDLGRWALLLKLHVVMATQHSAIAAERGDSGSCDHWEGKMSQPLPSVTLRLLVCSPPVTGRCWGRVTWWVMEYRPPRVYGPVATVWPCP